MKLEFEFRCSFRGYDLCFFGGKCHQDIVTQKDFCICPPGFGPDLITLHHLNCVMPDHFISVYAFIFFMVWFPVLFQFCSKLRRCPIRNKTLKDVAILTLFHHLSLGMIILGYFLQNGMFELSVVFGVIFFSLTSMIMARVLVLSLEMMRPKNSACVIDLRTKMNRVEKVTLTLNILTGIPPIVLIRHKYYDVFLCVATFSCCLAIAILGYLTFQAATNLEKELKRITLLPIDSLVQRVHRMKYFLFVNSLVMGGAMVTLIVCRFVLGSAPFFGFLIFGCALLANLVTVGIAGLLRDESSDCERKLPKNSVQYFSNTATKRSSSTLPADPNSSYASGGILGSVAWNIAM